MAKEQPSGKCPSCDAKVYGKAATCYRCGAKIEPDGSARPAEPEEHDALKGTIREVLTEFGLEAKPKAVPDTPLAPHPEPKKKVAAGNDPDDWLNS